MANSKVNHKNVWTIIYEDWPLKTGLPVAFMRCKYDVQAGLWYNEQSGGTYSAEEFAEFDTCDSITYSSS